MSTLTAKVTTKAKKVSGKKVPAKKATAKKVSQYVISVNNVNKALKNERKTLGGCIKTLLVFSKEIGMSTKDITALRFIQKDDNAFKAFKSTVRTSKYKGKDLGTYSPYYILQTLYKANKLNA
tara:strand:+ start:421 stop:789 length:369 start_codon:yes stop_codon:yes gene_type:complete